MSKNKNKQNESKVYRLLIAFVIAIILWISANGSSSDIIVEDIPNIPVNIINTQQLKENNLMIEDLKNYYVNIKLKGTENNLRQINVDEIVAQIDVGNVDKSGTITPEISISGLSNSVIIETLKPSTISLDIVNINERQYSVNIETKGQPANDQEVISTQCDTKVALVGSANNLARVDQVVAVAEVNGMLSDSTLTAEVRALDSDGNIVNNISYSPSEVSIDVLLGLTKEVAIKAPATLGDPKDGYKVTSITVNPTTKTVGAKSDQFDTISDLSIDAISVLGESSSFTREVELKLPDGVYFPDNNDRVEVTVNIEAVKEKTYEVTKISSKNLAEGFTAAKIENTTVKVTLKGTQEELDEITAEDIELSVDLTGKIKGTYDVPLSINLSKSLIETIEPETVEVTIE